MRISGCGVLAFCLSVSSPAYAQAPRGEVAGAFVAGREAVGGDFPQGGGWGWGWNGSFAVRMSERMSLVGSVLGLHQSVDTTLRIQEPEPLSIPFSATVDTVAFAGGVRVHGNRSPRVRPFAQVLLGYSRANAVVEVLGGLDLAGLSVDPGISVSGPAVIPGVGVDIEVADRAALRFQGDVPSVFSGGTVSSALFLSAGLVFAVGN